MSARNRVPPIPGGGLQVGLPPPSLHDPPFLRDLRAESHHTIHNERRESLYNFPPHPAIIEERMAAQHDDIQTLLIDNQRLAASHVALRQELEVTQYEFQQADKYAHALHAEKDLKTRELYEKSIKLENELHAVGNMKSELMQVHMDVKELTAARQELNAQIQTMTRDLGRVNSDLQKVPAVKMEIGGLKQELEQARAAVEYEKKRFAESFEHGKVIEGNLNMMAQEMEKLKAELANVEKRASAGPVGGNAGICYNANNYGNPEHGYPRYPGNTYPVGYDMPPTNTMCTRHLLPVQRVVLYMCLVVGGNLMIPSELKDPDRLVHAMEWMMYMSCFNSDGLLHASGVDQVSEFF